MEYASDKVSIRVGNQDFSYKDFNMGVCPQKACGYPTIWLE